MYRSIFEKLRGCVRVRIFLRFVRLVRLCARVSTSHAACMCRLLKERLRSVRVSADSSPLRVHLAAVRGRLLKQAH